MNEVRKADSAFTNWTCSTAVEAVERFRRLQRDGLNPQVIPEALIDCAKGLSGTELDLFEEWIICPNAVKGISHAIIGEVNYKEHRRIIAAHEKIDEECESEDEKVSD